MDLAITQSMIKQNNGTNNYYNEKNVFNRKKTVGSHSKSNGPDSGQPAKGENSEDPVNYMDDDYQKKQAAVQNLIKTANSRLNLYVNNENIKKSSPVTVQIYLIFLRVGEIDNVKERFQADAYFEACWEDESVDIKTGFDPRQNWEPELFIENAVGNLKQDIKYKVERKDNKTKVYEMRNIKGIFWERLELWDFPLDIQSLSITITSSRNKNEVKFVPSSYNESTINTNDFQQQQEWNLYPHIETSKKYIYDVWNKHDRPCFTISSTISRRPGYFIYNAYMLIFLISVLGFVPFSFSYAAPHFRIQTTCLLILSSINFRWIVTQKLPTVSYLTTLDKYAIGALIFLVSLCAWHAIIGSEIFSSTENSLASNIDKYALFGISGLYVMFHLIYIVYFLVRYSRYSKIGTEQGDGSGPSSDKLEDVKSFKSENEYNNLNDDRPVSINTINVRPGTNKSSVSSVRPAEMLKPAVGKGEEKSTSSEIKYRNLTESPSTPTPIDQAGFNKQNTVNNPFNSGVRKVSSQLVK